MGARYLEEKLYYGRGDKLKHYSTKRKYKRIAKVFRVLGIIVVTLILPFGVALDLVYSGRLKYVCLENLIDWMKNILMPVGFRYYIANEIISGSMGISFTTLSLLLSMGINLSNRFEIKIFGIPRQELVVSTGQRIYKWLRILIYIFPFMMLICINLRLCVAGYIVLLYNMIFLIVEYVLIVRSYRWEKNVDYTVKKLLNVLEKNDNKMFSDHMEYQVWLEEIRLGIEKTDGWEKAEQLCEHFMQQISEFEGIKCYISSYFFFDIIFCRGSQNKLNNSALRCMKKYICSLYERKTNNWNEVSFCAMVKVIFRYWDELQINAFLKWFLDFANRSQGGDSDKIKYIEAKETTQIDILVVMIEEWQSHQETYRGLLNVNLESLWFRADFSDVSDKLYLDLFKIVDDIEENVNYEKKFAVEAYENLKEDFKDNYGISFIGSIIREKRG